MTHLVSLDPGLRGCGVAWWHANGSLAHVAYLRNPVKKGDGPAAWMGYTKGVYHTLQVEHFISEVPQVYRAGASKGDPDDLIQLAGVVGVFACLFHATTYTGVKPREWKGQVPKDVHHARLVKTLTPEELAMVEASAPPSLRHNVLDAVGIGRYWFTKREPLGFDLQRRAAPMVERPVRIPRRKFTR
jgi:hypothetical protein